MDGLLKPRAFFCVLCLLGAFVLLLTFAAHTGDTRAADDTPSVWIVEGESPHSEDPSEPASAATFALHSRYPGIDTWPGSLDACLLASSRIRAARAPPAWF